MAAIYPQDDIRTDERTGIASTASDASNAVAATNASIPGGTTNADDILAKLGVTNPIIMQNHPILPQVMPQKVRPDYNAMAPAGATKNETRRNSVGNLFQNLANTVKAAKQNQEIKKSIGFQMNLERLQVAMANPDDPQNKQVIAVLMSDKKFVKNLQESLDINFVGEDKNANSPFRKVLLKVMGKGAASGQSQPMGGETNGIPNGMRDPGMGGGRMPNNQAEQLLNRLRSITPRSPQVDPRIAAYGQLVKDGVMPDANHQLDVKKDVAVQELKNKSMAAQIAMHYDLTKALIKGGVEKALIAKVGKENAAKIMAQAQNYRTSMQHIDHARANEINSDKKALAAGTKEGKNLETVYHNDRDDYTKKQAEYDKALKTKKIDIGTLNRLRSEKTTAQEKMNSSRQAYETFVNKDMTQNQNGETDNSDQSQNNASDPEKDSEDFNKAIDELSKSLDN